jgi:hypothetical protein
MSDPGYTTAKSSEGYIATDPVPEYPPRLPRDTRRPVIIEGKQIAEIDLHTGDVLRAYRYDMDMMR